ncbi:MAG: DMT family transporter [Marinobacterium sp.]|nr:DMT family transporter [Marinobacterium sp.]
MKLCDLRDLILLATLWGGSFLLMRIAAPVFGPVVLIELRVLLAALFLLPFVLQRQQLRHCRQHSLPLTVTGLFNSALPFCLFSWALLELSGGFTAVINATAPLFGAFMGAVLFGKPLLPRQISGLVIGLGGVICLISSQGTLNLASTGITLLAAFAAAACYGYAANYSASRLQNVPALSQAFGSQLAAAVLLAIPAGLSWNNPNTALNDWLAVLILGVACTGVAYLLYFRLINRIGATGAVSVTFLIPAFAMGWGWLIISEPVTPGMLISTVIILLGTGLTTGLIPVAKVKALLGR